MKNILVILILIPLFVVSCNNEENSPAAKPVDIYAIDFKDIKGTSVTNPITIKLTTPSGEEINDVKQLEPNSLYHLIVKGAGAAFYRIKAADGFEVIANPSINKSPSEDFVFVIKTSEAATVELYVNIIPIHLDGRKMLRESPQVFLLPG